MKNLDFDLIDIKTDGRDTDFVVVTLGSELAGVPKITSTIFGLTASFASSLRRNIDPEIFM